MLVTPKTFVFLYVITIGSFCSLHQTFSVLNNHPKYLYFLQDKYDDAIIGVKSTALKFGDATWKWLSSFGIMMISSLLLTGYNAQLAWPYYLAVTVAAARIGNQVAWNV